MEDRISTYRENLHHCARPDDRMERSYADKKALSDYEALALKRMLSYYQDYTADGDEDREAIAQSYIEYIEMCIYDEERDVVVIYAHTDRAKDILNEANELYEREVAISIPYWETYEEMETVK